MVRIVAPLMLVFIVAPLLLALIVDDVGLGVIVDDPRATRSGNFPNDKG
jgi:hypothetical protein